MIGLAHKFRTFLPVGAACLLTSVVALAFATPTLAPVAQKPLVRVVRDPGNQRLCTLIGPWKDPHWRNTPGLEQSDLSLFEVTSEANASLGSRYRLGAQAFGSPKSPRLVKSDDCASMDQLAIAINDSFYAIPIMACHGGRFTYRIRPLGQYVEMATIQRSGPQGHVSHVVMHELMTLTNTGHKRNGCLIRITQANPNEKQFKICLPGLSSGRGKVAMLYQGRNLPSEAMNITCTAEPGFEGIVKLLMSEDVTPNTQPSSYGSGDGGANTRAGGIYNVYQ